MAKDNVREIAHIWRDRGLKKPVSMIDYYSDQKSNKRKQAMENVAQKNEKSISGAIKVDEKEVMEHLDGLVRRSCPKFEAEWVWCAGWDLNPHPRKDRNLNPARYTQK